RDEREVATRRVAVFQPCGRLHLVLPAAELERLIAALVERQRRARPGPSDQCHGLPPDEAGGSEDRDTHLSEYPRAPARESTGSRRRWTRRQRPDVIQSRTGAKTSRAASRATSTSR